jgi:hypothetical protein
MSGHHLSGKVKADLPLGFLYQVDANTISVDAELQKPFECIRGQGHRPTVVDMDFKKIF